MELENQQATEIEEQQVQEKVDPRSLNELAHEIKTVLHSDRDFLLAISGGTGEGKSVLAQQIAHKVDPKFNIRKQTVFTRVAFKALLKDPETIPQFSCIVADEAVNILFRRDFMQTGQKELLRLLDMCRDRNLLLILNVPNVWSLDSHIVQSRLRAWMYVGMRGVAYTFMPDSNPFCNDRWHRGDNEKKMKNWAPAVVPTRSKNYVGTVEFDDLPDHRKEVYLAVKADKKEGAEQYTETEKKEIKSKEVSIALAVLGQLFDLGWLKKNHITQLSPSFGKSYRGMLQSMRYAQDREGYVKMDMLPLKGDENATRVAKV